MVALTTALLVFLTILVGCFAYIGILAVGEQIAQSIRGSRRDRQNQEQADKRLVAAIDKALMPPKHHNGAGS